jgi:hypothetical protein
MVYDHRGERRRCDEVDIDEEKDRGGEAPSSFDREFGAWLDKRTRQRGALRRISGHMEVVGSDGGHVGTVDRTRGDHIVLTRNDATAGDVHHAIPSGWIEDVTDKVALNLRAEEAMERWRIAGRSRALFEREGSGSDGPHVLNRSFFGTYPEKP